MDDFKHTDELLIAMGGNSVFMRNGANRKTDRVLNGFYLMLHIIQQDPTLQKHTLYATMLNVKRYLFRYNESLPVDGMNDIVIAINHVSYMLTVLRAKQRCGVA
ncbi:hypothetical protein [Streptomyces californicus]|uniref:hypothetical protein n=1 Tax=Streptomyces californicus TaxID=67351 RepID=UPI00365D7728